MRALNRKLVRDLWHIKTQALAISLVIAAGVAMFVMSLSAFESLRLTQKTYYERYRFAHVFAGNKRAPLSLRHRIAQIPGVAEVETRVVVDVTLDVEGVNQPAVGRLISVPERRRSMLNDIFLRRGRYLEAGRPDEVLVSEAFAEAHGLDPGDTVGAVVNGRRRELEIVGVALSPEYVYLIRPGELFPDDSSFGIFWMGGKALATAFDMEGGFNNVALSLMTGASEPDVIARLDRLLERYGGLGAIPRSLQISHWYVENEITQLQSTGFVVPLIFLGVAAFLLNVVLTRIVAVQREQIAALKALGYSNLAIGWHYVQWSLAVAVVGTVLGTGGGIWLASGLLRWYTEYFRFPLLEYSFSPAVLLGALVVSLVAATVGAAYAVRGAVRLPPAEAMRPAAPAVYRETWIERLGWKRFLSQPVRIILRNVLRRPVRSSLTILGVAFAVAILIIGSFFLDSIDELMSMQFSVAQRQDVTLSFFEPAASGALHEVRSLPGVLSAEPVRTVAARLRSGHRSRQIGIMGLLAEARLQRVVAASYKPVTLPEQGLVVSTKLAEILGVTAGDWLEVEVLEGERPRRRVQISALVEEYMGTSAYMEIGALRRLMREGRTLSGAVMEVDSNRLPELYESLKGTPSVAGVALKQAAIESFQKTLAESLGIMISFYLFFSSVIAFGVVYNGARVSLSERARELASLRVMGFMRTEISFILLGELALLTLVALPVGWLLGYGLAALAVNAFSTELFRIPLIVQSDTYAVAALVVLLASAISSLVVRRRLDRLDLVAVLKTRE